MQLLPSLTRRIKVVNRLASVGFGKAERQIIRFDVWQSGSDLFVCSEVELRGGCPVFDSCAAAAARLRFILRCTEALKSSDCIPCQIYDHLFF